MNHIIFGCPTFSLCSGCGGVLAGSLYYKCSHQYFLNGLADINIHCLGQLF